MSRIADNLALARRFWVGVVMSVPLLALAMGAPLVQRYLPGFAAYSKWVQLLLATPVVLWGDGHFFSGVGHPS